VRDRGADAGFREKRGDTGPTRPKLLGERTLWGELDFELPGEILAFELAVLSDVAGDEFDDLTCLEQLSQAKVVDAGVVRDDGEAPAAALEQGVDESLWDAAEAKSANSEELVVLDEAVQGGLSVWVHLVHEFYLATTK
jgi:hypothetical protein